MRRGVYTHLGCLGFGLLLGIAVWKATGGPPADAGGNSEASNGKSPSFRASDRSHDRAGGPRSGTELLQEIAPAFFGQDRAERTNYRRSWGSYLRDSTPALLKAADELPRADDVAAAAIEKLTAMNNAMLGGRQQEGFATMKEVQSRLIHWLREDPAAALRYLAQNPARGIDLTSSIYAFVHDQGMDKAVALLREHGGSFGAGYTSSLGMYAASQGDVGQLDLLKQTMTPDQWKRVTGQIGNTWPMDKADSLFAFAVSNGTPNMATSLALANGKEGADWLMAKLASGELDPAAVQAIRGSNDYRQILMANPHLPFEERLSAMGGDNPGQDKELLALQLGGRDVTNALNNAEKDWRFAFRNGKVGYEEVFDAVAASMPELAAASPDAIRLQLLKELAEDNGPAALEALAHTPEPDRWTLALKPTQWNFYNVNPQEFYDYLQHIPHSDPGNHQARFESWVWHSKSNLDLYSRDYVDWVKALPEGVDREMAAIGVLRNTLNNKALQEEMDALVVDPALRARIQAPEPTK